MIKLIVATSGYVESCHLSRMFFTCLDCNGMEQEEALNSLAEDLREAYKNKYCKPKVSRCPACKQKVTQDSEFDIDSFVSFVYDLNKHEIHESNFNLSNWYQYDRFEDIYGAFSDDEIIVIEEQFEVIMASSLNDDDNSILEYKEKFPIKIRNSGFYYAERDYNIKAR